MEFGSFQDFLKARTGIEVSPHAVLSQAHDIMQDQRASTLIVVDEGTLHGVISEADILRHVSQYGGFDEIKVSQVMRSDVEWLDAVNMRSRFRSPDI